MSERGNFRGGRGRGEGGGRGGGRGGSHAQGGEKKPKENILDLSKYMDQEIAVKFSGGREVTGQLKGYDQLMNLVLDNVKEVVPRKHIANISVSADQDAEKLTSLETDGSSKTRSLGMLVARGTLLVLISPVDGSEEIPNPFLAAEEDE